MAFIGWMTSLNTYTANLHEFTMGACPADTDLEIEISRYYDMGKI